MPVVIGIAVAGALGALARYRLLELGHTGQAFFNAFGTLFAGLVAVWVGLEVGKAL